MTKGCRREEYQVQSRISSATKLSDGQVGTRGGWGGDE